MSTWESALDTLEERLRRQEAVAAMSSDDLPDEHPPDVDGPLPAELRPRALALLERTRRLEALVEARLAEGPPRRPSYGGGLQGDGGTDHGGL